MKVSLISPNSLIINTSINIRYWFLETVQIARLYKFS